MEMPVQHKNNKACPASEVVGGVLAPGEWCLFASLLRLTSPLGVLCHVGVRNRVAAVGLGWHSTSVGSTPVIRSVQVKWVSWGFWLFPKFCHLREAPRSSVHFSCIIALINSEKHLDYVSFILKLSQPPALQFCLSDSKMVPSGCICIWLWLSCFKGETLSHEVKSFWNMKS